MLVEKNNGTKRNIYGCVQRTR